MTNKENKEKKPIFIRLAYIFSPLILLGLLCLIGAIQSYQDIDQSQGWSAIGIIITVPVLLIALLVDFLLKQFLKKDFLHIWITELILVVIGVIIYFNLIV